MVKVSDATLELSGNRFFDPPPKGPEILHAKNCNVTNASQRCNCGNGKMEHLKISIFEKVKNVMSDFCAKNNFSPFAYFDFWQRLKCAERRDTGEKVLYMVKK